MVLQEVALVIAVCHHTGAVIMGIQASLMHEANHQQHATDGTARRNVRNRITCKNLAKHALYRILHLR